MISSEKSWSAGRAYEKCVIKRGQYICEEPSVLIATLAGVFEEEHLPKEYIGLPYFNF